MRYREIPSAGSLAHLVECFWTLEGRAAETAPHPERILPDGCVELILNLGAPFQEVRPDGGRVVQPRRFLVGQMTRPMMILPAGDVELIGIRFHPGGTLPFFRHPMDAVTDQVVELAALSGTFERELTAAVGRGATLRGKIGSVERVLISQARRCPQTSWLPGLAAEIVRRAGQISIDALADRAGISSRQLERRFQNDIGIGPKLFCRIVRFQETFRAIESHDPEWAAVAVDCGYYDQAHLIRDFQRFAGQTPSVLITGMSRITEAFTRRHRRSDFSNPRTGAPA